MKKDREPKKDIAEILAERVVLHNLENRIKDRKGMVDVRGRQEDIEELHDELKWQRSPLPPADVEEWRIINLAMKGIGEKK